MSKHPLCLGVHLGARMQENPKSEESYGYSNKMWVIQLSAIKPSPERTVKPGMSHWKF